MKNESIFALATDTVWGLGTKACSPDGVERIYQIKERDRDKPLILFVESMEEAGAVVEIPQELTSWLQQFWPGSLTFISKAKSDKYSHCHPNTEYMGVRIPNHPAVSTAHKVYGPTLAVTSLNLSNEPTIKDLEELHNNFKHSNQIQTVFGNECPNTSPSIIVKLDGHKLLVLRDEGKLAQKLAKNLPDNYYLNSL